MACNLGLLNYYIPIKLGGLGFSILDGFILESNIFKRDTTLSIINICNNITQFFLFVLGNNYQKTVLIRKIQKNKNIGCYAILNNKKICDSKSNILVLHDKYVIDCVKENVIAPHLSSWILLFVHCVYRHGYRHAVLAISIKSKRFRLYDTFNINIKNIKINKVDISLLDNILGSSELINKVFKIIPYLYLTMCNVNINFCRKSIRYFTALFKSYHTKFYLTYLTSNILLININLLFNSVYNIIRLVPIKKKCLFYLFVLSKNIETIMIKINFKVISLFLNVEHIKKNIPVRRFKYWLRLNIY